jgi:hypothetical protein
MAARELEVHERPREPCTNLQYGETLAHHRHAAFVKVAKRARRELPVTRL